MHLKLNLQTPSSKDAVDYYAILFNGTIIKEGENESHAYVKLFDQVSLHLHTNKSFKINSPYLILRFNKDEEKIFNETIERIKGISNIKIQRELTEHYWGTKLFKFIDKYGYQWVLEIDI